MNGQSVATCIAHPLSRRRFVQGAGVVGLGLLAGCGRWPGQEPASLPRIGYLSMIPMALSPRLPAFRQGLQEVGYQEGHNLLIEWRSAENRQERLPTLLSELIALPVDLLVAPGEPVAAAAKHATTTLPIVTLTTDLVNTGLVASLARPGGNVTGLTDMAPQLTGKRLELLQAVVPNTVRVGVLWNVDYAAATVAWTETRDAARVLALEPVPLGVRTGADLERVFETSSREVEAMLVLMDPLLLGERARIVDLAAQYGLPVMYPSPDFTAAGGLMTYGANHDDLFRRLAVYVDKILKGAKPADLPVEQPMTFEFIINAKAAQALGLTIPQQVLLQATEVIQ